MSGRSWSSQEEGRLVEELTSGVKIEQIALNHNRSSGAIHSRQRHLVGVYYVDGLPIDEIMKKLKLNFEQVRRTLERRGLVSGSNNPQRDVGTQTSGDVVEYI
jgi:hypothetical protein